MKLNTEIKYEILLSNGEVKTQKLGEILGDKKTILYFYPKDNTPGCTIENKDFTCLKGQFEEKGYKLIGVSKDSIESHKKFVEKQELKIDLLSDPELLLHKELLAYGEKNNYGKIVQGVIRSTFILDNSGEVLEEFRSIRAKGHAERILKSINN
ncbi:MAG: peroxiredoxin [Candidatus Gracilibacteria bacterium]|nr:peroxiredoxin [Candidatus Gracilibacteria bacterium]MDQ7023068.1 peroxiredoxin [Candidatus Gracilibacteria bacterium]